MPGADLFAAAIVIYEMLTGRPPFGGDSPVQVMHAVMYRRGAGARRLRGRRGNRSGAFTGRWRRIPTTATRQRTR